MKIRFAETILVVTVTFGLARLARAQTSFYSDRFNFFVAAQAVPGIQQSISFGLFAGGPAVTVSDITFTGRFLDLSAINSGPALFNFDSPVPLGVHFAKGALAFGADFSSGYTAVPSLTATLSLDNGQSFQFTAATQPNSTFFGFISASPIMDVTFSDGGIFHPEPSINFHEELIGNIYAVKVPEPAGIALEGFGAALLLGWRLRKKSRCKGITA